jgi:hypothetical protein
MNTDVRITLKPILKKCDMREWYDFKWLRLKTGGYGNG